MRNGRADLRAAVEGGQRVDYVAEGGERAIDVARLAQLRTVRDGQLVPYPVSLGQSASAITRNR